jgi:ribosomal protein S18 acetylase RimI-like enzyme
VLDAIATEQGPWLLMAPGEIKPRDWKVRIAQATATDTDLIIVPTIDGRVVGSLGLYADPRTKVCAHVRALGMSVAAECRRLGVGTALVDAALGWARSNGVTRVVLSVLPHNAPAIAFYERHGFIVEGRRREQFILAGVAYDEVLMARSLKDRAR